VKAEIVTLFCQSFASALSAIEDAEEDVRISFPVGQLVRVPLRITHKPPRIYILRQIC
jgi:hypothetical protein